MFDQETGTKYVVPVVHSWKGSKRLVRDALDNCEFITRGTVAYHTDDGFKIHHAGATLGMNRRELGDHRYHPHSPPMLYLSASYPITSTRQRVEACEQMNDDDCKRILRRLPPIAVDSDDLASEFKYIIYSFHCDTEILNITPFTASTCIAYRLLEERLRREAGRDWEAIRRQDWYSMWDNFHMNCHKTEAYRHNWARSWEKIEEKRGYSPSDLWEIVPPHGDTKALTEFDTHEYDLAI